MRTVFILPEKELTLRVSCQTRVNFLYASSRLSVNKKHSRQINIHSNEYSLEGGIVL